MLIIRAMPSSSRREGKAAQAAIAVIALALAIACVALIVEAGRRIYHSIGPSKAVAAADGSLYVLSHGKLHIFAPDGTRREAISLESLGLTRTPSDLALHRDGRVVLADPDTSFLQRCRLPHGPCQPIDLQLHRADLQKIVPLNSIKVAIDEEAQRYYVSDNAGHQVVIADFAGKVLARSKPYAFWYPNHLFVAAPGELSVVDTNHHRIATVDVHGDRFGRELRVIEAGRSVAGRAGHVWPFDAARLPDGRMVVLVAADGMKDADVIVMDGAARRRIDLGAGSDPFDVEAWNGRIIVADATHYRLQAIDANGTVASDFPPAVFRDELEHEREVPAFWRSVRMGAQVSVVLVPLVAILLLWRLGAPFGVRPAVASPNPAHAPDDKAVHVLTFNPAYLARQRRTLMLVAAIFVLATAALGLFIALRAPDLAALHLRRLLPLAAVVPLAIFTWALAWRQVPRRASRIRLESAPAQLDVSSLALVSRSRLRVPWRDVYWDGKSLLAGTTMLMVRVASGPPVFEWEAFERFVLSRIPASNRVSSGRLWTLALKARSPQAMLAVAAIALVIVVEVARTLRHL